MSKKHKVVISKLQAVLGEKNVKVLEPLKKHTSFGIGGACRALVEPKTPKELEKIVKIFNDNKVTYYLIGNGTNLLVNSKGVKAYFIKLSTKFSGIYDKGTMLEVLAGTSLKSLISYAAKKGLSGLEGLSGVPGSVGGATYMNAGAYGVQISDLVIGVTALYKGKIVYLKKSELDFSYRNSLFQKNKGYIILKTHFLLKKGEPQSIKKTCKEILTKRNQNLPKAKSAGSVFKRHPNLIASKTIDELNLKGFSINDAQISTKHAGIIINKGNATSSDVLKLIKIIQKAVYKKHKVKFELEVQVIGE